MAKFVLKQPYISIGGTDLSDHVRSVTLNYGSAVVDQTTGGDGTITNLAGLLNWSISVEFAQDFLASNVDATLFPLVGADNTAVEIRPDTGAVSATNPKFTGNAVLSEYNPLGGSIGDLAVAPVTLQGDDTLTRATA